MGRRRWVEANSVATAQPDDFWPPMAKERVQESHVKDHHPHLAELFLMPPGEGARGRDIRR